MIESQKAWADLVVKVGWGGSSGSWIFRTETQNGFAFLRTTRTLQRMSITTLDGVVRLGLGSPVQKLKMAFHFCGPPERLNALGFQHWMGWSVWVVDLPYRNSKWLFIFVDHHNA